ncbi:MAG: hypothetical protein DME26_14310, partial [Verrucomicrobia bacterium]
MSRYDGRSFQNFSTNNGLPVNRFWGLIIAANGDVWLRTFFGSGGVVRYDGAQFHRYTTTDGLADDAAWCARESPGGLLWFGSGNGLTRFDGKTFTVFTKNKDRLGSAVAADILSDRDGVLWIAGEDGVTRHDSVDELWSTLPAQDITLGNNIAAVVQDQRGDFWFGSRGNLTRYTPSRAQPRSPQITVVAEKEFDEHESVAELTAGRRAVLKLSVVDLKTRAESRRFRWQFASDKSSIDASRHARGWLPARRETQFEWQTNRAGTYSLAVQYIDRDLNYSSPTFLTLRVSPVWYANAWITVPGGGAALGLVGWAFIARSLVIRRKREAEQLRERLLEQERRARELLQAKNAELEKATAAAQAASKAKSAFLANMSH